ncbi:hypothetical protein F5Y03DRAFT_331611 [Xylaria venustula]|nr:hypothetical protein F5Y03DRAFT_331611 [Xylaria venustula]
MARRKVVADSEDEDEGDDVFLLQPAGEPDRPEPEPLSPHHQTASDHNPSSGVTNPSFFANIYDAQQILAVQQSHLVEQIVQQSQRASGSSGDVSLPAKKRPRVNPSSGTDVTSPMVLSRPSKKPRLSAGDASEFTTPRKSTGQEWDVPSSPEDETTAHHTKYPASKEETHGGRGRTDLRMVSSPVAVMSVAGETTPRAPYADPTGEQRVDDALIAGSMSTRAAQRAGLSHHDYSLPETPKFYIAQSSLTTMQKLEYQKVNVPNGYGGLLGSLPNHKSSGATTIAYSTPSGYSSIPPLPGDEPLAQTASPRQDEIINISSSADVLDSGFGLPSERAPVADMGIGIPAPTLDCDSLLEFQSRTPATKKRKRSRNTTEEDELCQDNDWDPAGIDAPQDSYTPRAVKRRSGVAKDLANKDLVNIGNNVENFEDISNEPMPPTQSPPKCPAPALPDTDPLETEPEPLPRKRGRKRKQAVIDVPPTQPEINEDLHLNQDTPASDKPATAEPSPGKPKKKRGRPRKSELSKAVAEPIPESPVVDEPPEINSPRKGNSSHETDPISTKQKDGKNRLNKKGGSVTEEDEVTAVKESRSPLKEVDNNLGTPSKLSSTRGSATNGGTEPEAEKSMLKAQSKVRYRVGLSKRSRIAPLLKCIKK